MKKRLRFMATLSAALFNGTAGASLAAPDAMEAKAADLQRIASQAREPGRGVSAVLPLLTGWMGGPHIPAPAASAKKSAPDTDMPRAKLGKVPVGLALASLNSVSAGPVTSLSKLGSSYPVLVIREGRLTLRQLVEDAEAQFPDSFEASADGAVADWPILIWSDAQLLLESGDRLVLSGGKGSFILNTGLLRMEGASVSIGAGAPAALPEFRPFIATVFAGAVQAHDSEFTGLGFAGAPGAAGLAFAGAPMSLKLERTTLSGNAFRDTGGVAIRQSSELEVSGNRFVASRFSSLRLIDVTDARISENVLVDSEGPIAIEVGGQSRDVVVSHNIVLSGRGFGIRVSDGAYAVRVSDNVASGLSEDGIAIERAACVDIQRNIAMGNGANGVSVRRSGEISLTGNRLFRNARAGVFLRAQAEAAVTVLDGNIFAENGSGVRGQASSRIKMGGNDFSDQLPIIVSGDLSGSLRQFLNQSRTGALTALPAASWAAPQDASLSLPRTNPTLPCKYGS
jgi:parallel beta-helix repeat protein